MHGIALRTFQFWNFHVNQEAELVPFDRKML